MGVEVRTYGNFPKLTKWLKKMADGVDLNILNKYGEMGVEALKEATPKRTGDTASQWIYRVATYKYGAKITFYNTHMEQGHNIAILLQIGHGTGTGGWVEGIDYINPALRPVFKKLAAELKREVSAQ